MIVGALLPKPIQQVECSFPGVVAETFQSVSSPISVFCSCLNLEGYSVGVVLCFVGFGPPNTADCRTNS